MVVEEMLLHATKVGWQTQEGAEHGREVVLARTLRRTVRWKVRVAFVAGGGNGVSGLVGGGGRDGAGVGNREVGKQGRGQTRAVVGR